MAIRVTLPWPPRELSPNGRAHHMAKHRAAKLTRADAAMWCRAAGLRGGPADAVVRLTLHKPNARIDGDNAIASTKAILDGIADALGHDDHELRVSYRFGPAMRCGAVVVEVDVPANGPKIEGKNTE
jgi:crossover junction endodeoxyribonuclease RusA